MKSGFWYRLDIFTRLLTPFLLTLALVLINIVPFHVPGLARVIPVLPLIAVFHWAVYRAELLPTYAVFVIGILFDIFSGTPVGAHTIVFLLVYGIVVSQQRFLFGKSFGIIWLGFGLVSAAAFILEWALISLWHFTLIEPSPVFYQYLLTLGAFPGLAWVLLRWQKFIIREL